MKPNLADVSQRVTRAHTRCPRCGVHHDINAPVLQIGASVVIIHDDVENFGASSAFSSVDPRAKKPFVGLLGVTKEWDQYGDSRPLTVYVRMIHLDPNDTRKVAPDDPSCSFIEHRDFSTPRFYPCQLLVTDVADAVIMHLLDMMEAAPSCACPRNHPDVCCDNADLFEKLILRTLRTFPVALWPTLAHAQDLNPGAFKVASPGRHYHAVIAALTARFIAPKPP